MFMQNFLLYYSFGMNSHLYPLYNVPILVSLSPAPAQAQPLGQAKLAIIYAYFLFFFFFSLLTKNLIKGGISGRIVENKS